LKRTLPDALSIGITSEAGRTCSVAMSDERWKIKVLSCVELVFMEQEQGKDLGPCPYHAGFFLDREKELPCGFKVRSAGAALIQKGLLFLVQIGVHVLWTSSVLRHREI
jgi:hypothetical protein